MWICAGLSVAGDRREPGARAELLGFMLLAGTGPLALVIAGDLVTLYAGFALLSFASYGLILAGLDDDPRADQRARAGRVYVVFAVIAELLLFAGLILAVTESESLELAELRRAIAGSERRALITALLFAGFGVKASVLFVHLWTPLAYAAAPVPGAALLGGALVKAGALAWLRILPIGLVGQPQLAGVVLSLGLTAALDAVLVGLPQRRSEHILAYSSISQMGLITAALGLATPSARRRP